MRHLSEASELENKSIFSEEELMKLQHDITMIGSSLQGLAHLLRQADQEDPNWDVAELILGIKQNVYSIANRIDVKILNSSVVMNGKLK